MSNEVFHETTLKSSVRTVRTNKKNNKKFWKDYDANFFFQILIIIFDSMTKVCTNSKISQCVKFLRYNIKQSQHRHVLQFSTSKVVHTNPAYDRYPHTTAHTHLEWSITYRDIPTVKRRFRESAMLIFIIIIMSGATARSRVLASLTGFVTGILRCRLSPHDQPDSSHPDSTTRDI
jgi:hypothetical protein